jgi:hypothetical protein
MTRSNDRNDFVGDERQQANTICRRCIFWWPALLRRFGNQIKIAAGGHSRLPKVVGLVRSTWVSETRLANSMPGTDLHRIFTDGGRLQIVFL